MKTILEVLNYTDLSDNKEDLIFLIDEEVESCKNGGDVVGAGEWLISKLPYASDDEIEGILSRTVALWASPLEFKLMPNGIDELISSIELFVPEDLAISLVAVTTHFLHASISLPQKTSDLAFRLSSELMKLYEVSGHRPIDVCMSAAAKLETIRNEMAAAVSNFLNTKCITAKTASIEVVKKGHHFKRYAVAGERSILSDIDILLGASFRKYCESYERQDSSGVVRRGPDITEQVQQILASKGSRTNSVNWNLTVGKIARHVLKLVDEGSSRSAYAMTPSLKLSSNIFKIDLTRINKAMTFTGRLVNVGEGPAFRISFRTNSSGLPVDISVIEPTIPFDMAGKSEQIVKFRLILNRQLESFNLSVQWVCQTLTGATQEMKDDLSLEQQLRQPDWEVLVKNPPYTLNPVKKRQNLYGRDYILNQLLLHAAGGTSTFLWGQKRIGKTSIIQVLEDELRNQTNFVCVLLRMGELGPLHEGQIAHRIAERISKQIQELEIAVPGEQELGAGLGNLIPFVDSVTKKFPDKKFIIIIDEFDDIDPAFYIGERGKQFVKALRSLSEIGLTFFFVGSERMNTIYNSHSLDLNKWVNMHLDYIESREDCKKIIMDPVSNVIEYDIECVNSIIEYCGCNPFYIHLLCHVVFERCYPEERTYVSSSDLNTAADSLLKSIGPANFSHFWNDNPVLGDEEKAKQSAENCLILSCISMLGGKCESTDDIVSIQESFNLHAADRLNNKEIRETADRLRRRGIFTSTSKDGDITIRLPIFKDWIRIYHELEILPLWNDYCQKKGPVKGGRENERPIIEIVEYYFPISEEQLLSISQNLYYLGRQKDTAEIRSWLKQFDDDTRIEIAYLLLKRLSESGFVKEGPRLQMIQKLEEAVQAKRQDMGNNVWNIVKDRRANLCITFVDSDVKSGAATARELRNRMRPGKCGDYKSTADWMPLYSKNDPIVLIVDDFAGSGTTLSTGINHLFENIERKLLQKYLNEGRILCYTLYSFPEAMDKLKKEFPEVHFLSMNTFGDDVRALDQSADIFKNENEIKFAKEMLLQIGRQLYKQYPFGYKDMAALVCFANTIPNNTLPIFWSGGTVNDKLWKPLFPRAS